MRIIRILAAALGAMAALLVLTGVLVVWLFDPNDYKDYLTEWAEARTGRTFSVEDTLEIEFFPWLAIETGGITVGNAEGFDAEPFATVERVAARVRLLPLLRREVEVGTITLEGLELNLAVDTDDRGNWEDLLRGPDAPDAGPAPDEPAAQAVQSLGIEGIRVRDGLVFWRENIDEVRYVISGLTLDTGSISADTPTDVELGFEILDVESQLTLGVVTEATVSTTGAVGARDLTLDFTLTDGQNEERARGRAVVDLAEATPGGAIAIGGMEIEGRLSDPPIGSGTVEVGAAWQAAELGPESQTLRIDGLVTTVSGVEARWQITGDSMFADPRVAGSVAVDSARLADALELLAVALPDGIDPDTFGRFDGRADFSASLDSRQIELTNVNANLLGLTSTGQASFDGADRLRADVEIAEFETSDALRALLGTALPATIDAAAFTRLAFTGSVDWSLATGSLTLGDYDASLLGAAATGELEVTPGPDGTAVRGNLRTSPFAPDAFAAAFAAFMPENIGVDELGTLAIDTEFSYDPRSDSAILDPAVLEIFGLRGTGRMTASGLSGRARFEGSARFDPFSPRELLSRFGQPVPRTSDPSALRSAIVTASFEIDAAGGQFGGIDVLLDESRISGDITVNDFRNPAYRFTLAADRIDVDRYLPPRAGAAEDEERVAGDIALSPRALDALDIDGRVEVGDLTLAGMSFQNVLTPIILGEGRAELSPARADLYGGEFEGSVSVDTTGEQPSLSLSGQAIDLELSPLIEALAGEANLSGTGNFDLTLTGRGQTITENLRSAEGSMSFALRDGAIAGFNLGRAFCAAFNAVEQRLPPDDSVPEQTSYELIQGAATVSEGIARSNELLARTAFMDITGAGRLTLVDQQLNYALESKLTGPIDIRGCEPMSDMIGDSIPWTLNGTVTDAEIRPDFGDYLRQRIEDEAADALRERVEERLRELL